MPDGPHSLTLTLHEGIEAMTPELWDGLVMARDGTDNPFMRHDFLAALEESGCIGPETGWVPRHALITDAQGRGVAAAPMYLKSHSYGEYVFDWAWADAYERAGGRYYPKLLVASPFSPVTGPRLLGRAEDTALAGGLLGALRDAADRMGVSSLHILFPRREEWLAAGQAGYLLREGRQFHWHNPGYRDFADFLAQLTSRKRKTLRKERMKATAEGLVIQRLTGDAIRPEHWDAFHGFYRNTTARKWGHPYLNRAFFESLGQRMADRILLVMAFRDGIPVAGALNLFSDEALYGRNWGACEAHPMLHFECCYYQAMDFAIERGLKRVEAGAGGHHKIARGYVPEPTYSAHWIRDEGFRTAVARFLDAERDDVGRERDALAAYAPFRSGERVSGTPLREGEGTNDHESPGQPTREDEEDGF